MLSTDRIWSSDILSETGMNEKHFLYIDRCPQQGIAAIPLSIPAPCIETSSKEWRTGGPPTTDCEFYVTVQFRKFGKYRKTESYKNDCR